jgi:hypothetical protein
MESSATPSPAPAFLVQGSLQDNRVPAGGMLRWATQMRRRAGQMQLQSGCGSQPPMLLTMSDDGDHLGALLASRVGMGFELFTFLLRTSQLALLTQGVSWMMRLALHSCSRCSVNARSDNNFLLASVPFRHQDISITHYWGIVHARL